MEQVSRHLGTDFKVKGASFHFVANIGYLVPQAGSPFAMTYGGKQVGDSFGALGNQMDLLASINDAISASAGLEATFHRRGEEWTHELASARQELAQVEQQHLAASIRADIAQKELDIHQASMDQADELYEFYKDKFTNLGLYTYLATTLSRLHREAYLIAYNMAQLAQQAYQFERDDDQTNYIADNNWQFDRAGLLAGEQLLVQLQRLENAYLTKNTRDLETTLSFSLALWDPSALILLRETGSCTYGIPEVFCQLAVPGIFNAIIQSVRVTIPCVAGPYTNVGAMLRLQKGSQIRRSSMDQYDPDTIRHRIVAATYEPASSSIFASAVHESGVFDLNFRDERYLPFEGAGAISQWTLDLPTTLRTFDYSTISTVIMQLDIRFKYDGKLKEQVEKVLVAAMTTLATTTGLFRLFSLRHDFPTSYHQLLTAAPQSTTFTLTQQHFPSFLASQNLKTSAVSIYLKPKGKDPIDTSTLSFDVNGTKANGTWPLLAGTNLSELDLAIIVGPIGDWKVTSSGVGLSKDLLDDIFIVLKYTIAPPT